MIPKPGDDSYEVGSPAIGTPPTAAEMSKWVQLPLLLM
jgi:hypothetical protein